MNWVRIEDMKADVEPFPFVPAMCIVLRELKWDGCPQRSQFENRNSDNRKGAFIPHSQSFCTILSFQG
jgi:hypothetical protein